jgi:chemotaxis signal transduction protein/nucleoid-associated protein YgaU
MAGKMMEVLLFSIQAHHYSVRKGQVGSVEKVGAVHRMPFLRSSVTVLAVIGDHTCALADLAPCLGHQPDQGKSGATALVMSQQGQIRGFLINAEPDSLTVEPGAVIPMPDYLRIPFVEGFILQGGDLVPVLAAQALLEQLARQGNPSKTARHAIEGVPGTETLTPTTFRLIDAGGSLLALREQVVQSTSGSFRILRFPLLPSDIDGVTLFEKQVLPVIDIARRISCHPLGESPLLFKAKVGNAYFGLLVDGDREEWGPEETIVKDLPFICQTPWLRKTAIHRGQVAAIIDLAALVSNPEHPSDPGALSKRYQPESAFPALFGHHEVEVIELLVKGRRLAIPKIEVIEVIPYAPIHAVPHAPGVVAGVEAFAGDLLPVIDLARVQGENSSPTPQWSMIHLSNGNFRALVLTERAPEARLLKPEVQRDVPVHLPYPVVYGCYLEGDTITLILNIHTLALHFDESRAADLLPPLSMVETTQEVETQLSEKTESKTSATVTSVETVALQATRTENGELSTRESAPKEPLLRGILPLADEHATEKVNEEQIETAKPDVSKHASLSASPAPSAMQEEKHFIEEMHVHKQIVVERPTHRGRRMIAAFAASVLLIVGSVCGLYFSGLAQKPPGAHDGGEQAATAQTPTLAAPQSSTPALITAPAPQLVESSMYVVKEGDTLWDIAGRLTGDPLNYRNIAGRNLIRDPDLIFPGQVIRVGLSQKQ